MGARSEKLDAARRALAAAEERQNTRVPSRAALARKWPRLRVNRMSWAWIDEASGERGYTQASLLEYLRKEARPNGET
ncbi:MAG TPA: hypothetical protein VIF40_20480 [Methylosinus sp.]|jgi:hypothetical protein|uniref:hypothetical protein n=1 Tax=Methylosinus sp. TaxID=427 RepID=UPI002F92F793